MADSEKLPVQRHRNADDLKSPQEAEVLPAEKKSKRPKKKEKKYKEKEREKEKRKERERKIEEEVEEEQEEEEKKVTHPHTCALLKSGLFRSEQGPHGGSGHCTLIPSTQVWWEL